MTLPTDSQWARYSALCAHLRPLPPAACQAQLAAWQGAGVADPQVLSLVALHYALPPDPDRDRTGERLGPFTLEAPLGAGGMGIVYRAQQHIGLTTRPVAVKLIHPALLRTAREEALTRFQAEMGTLVQLEHESIARIYDGGIGEDPHTHEPLPYIAMEFVRGGLPITTYAQDSALAWQERLQLFLRVCRAVQYAHEHRIVHRDLKPANILVDGEGRPFVIDFGLASACDALLPGVPLASGTPAYMSPEQVSAAWGAVSAKSDVYALGLILYELLTEQPPYALPPHGAWEQMRDVITTATPRPLGQHRPEYHGELEALVAHALAKRPADRCSVAELRSRLERFVQAQPARLARVEGERKQVTVLCADMQGYTPLAETLGEEGVYDLMNQVYERLITAVHQEGGTVQELTGDGILALFGAPGALENAPLRACRAALTMQAQLRSVGVAVEAKHGVHSKARIGIHTGQVVVGTVGTDLRMEYKAVGDPVNLAARLESTATPGSILLSEATYRLVEGYVQSTFVGERDVKGKSVPQRVYRLAGLKAGMARFDIARQRGLTPLIGRECELERLEHYCDAVRQDGLHIVHVIGEAGIGKSRLIYEFHQRLRATPILFLQGHCTAAGQSTSFLPFIEIVRSLLRLGEGEDQQEVTRKICHGLEDLGMPPDTSLPLLLALLGLEGAGEALRGLDGEIIGARTRAVLQGLLLLQCHSAPVVLCLEDLHWIDTASEALLRQIMQSGTSVPLLLLCSSRPPYQLPWAGRPHVTALPLAPLSEESTLALVKQCLGTDALPEELAQLIGEKTEGNPLFAEEITRYLLESGILRRTNGRIAWQPVGQAVQMPATLQDLLLARVDGLAEAPRALLQVAAVLGHRFPVDLLRTIYGGHDDTFAQCLQELEAHDLIARQETEGRATYQFTHVLIQDTLYTTLLTPRREVLHQRVGEAIERHYPAHLSEWVDVLAHHWCRTARVDKAVHYLALAGEKNLRVYALVEAHACFRQVVERIETAPRGAYDTVLADVLVHWARVYYYQKDFKGLIALVEPYWSRLMALDDRRRLSLLCFWLGFAYAFGWHCAEAERLLEQALGLGEAIDDAECIGYASMGLMWFYAYWRQGDAHAYDRVEGLGHRTLAIATRLHDVYLASKCLLCFVLHRGSYSRFQEARTACAQLFALGEEARDPRTTAMGLWALAFVDVLEERFEEAIERTEEALRLSPDLLDRLTAQGIKGVALVLRGQGQEGRAIFHELREVRQEMVAGEYLFPLASFDIPYGVTLVLTGQIAAGVRWIEETMQRCGALGTVTQYAWGHLCLGEIYLQMALGQAKLPLRLLLQNLGFILRTLPRAARKAQYHLDEAIRRARALEMPGILARALLDLSMLSQARKRVAEARVALEEARDITERWASPPLQAKICAALASLDDLASP